MPDIYAALAAMARRAAKEARAAAATAQADDVIADSALLLPWEPGKYAIGDVRTHDSVGNEAWAPGDAPALWAPYHATSAKWALPYVQPTGAHDAYQAGEYMRWADGLIYRCKVDATVHGPVALPSAWEVAT